MSQNGFKDNLFRCVFSREKDLVYPFRAMNEDVICHSCFPSEFRNSAKGNNFVSARYLGYDSEKWKLNNEDDSSIG